MPLRTNHDVSNVDTTIRVRQSPIAGEHISIKVTEDSGIHPLVNKGETYLALNIEQAEDMYIQLGDAIEVFYSRAFLREHSSSKNATIEDSDKRGD